MTEFLDIFLFSWQDSLVLFAVTIGVLIVLWGRHQMHHYFIERRRRKRQDEYGKRY